MKEVKKLKVLIVDDEFHSRELLKDMLSLVEGVEIAGCVTNAEDALANFQENRPDLVILDIEMPGKSGFDLVQEWKSKRFQPDIIFITAYDRYAIEAFKYSAFDFLLKPIVLEELKQTIIRYRKRISKTQPERKFERLFQYLSKPEKLKFDLRTGFLILEASELTYCEADGNYTLLYMRDGRKEIVTYNIGNVEEQLEKFNFFRLSRSVLINLDHVIKVDIRNRYCELKVDGLFHKFTIPRSKIRELEERF